MILGTSVGRARVCGFSVGWQGATTPRGQPRKEEQRLQAALKPCNRVRSALTQMAKAIEGCKACIYELLREIKRGQPRFSG